MRIILLSGFLGAGKTSFLIQLATYLAALPAGEGSRSARSAAEGATPAAASTSEGVCSTEQDFDIAAQTDSSAPPGIATAKVAILENEIGEVSVDSSVLSGLAGVGAGGAGGGIQLRELFSGCVCCSLAGELVDAVRDLQATVHPEWLIIEATGLAIPESAADLLRKAITDLEGLLTVVLVDAARFSVLEKISPLIGKQPKTADVLLLNKVDLVDEAVRGQVTSRLREINASASILEVVASEPIAQDVLAEMIKGA